MRGQITLEYMVLSLVVLALLAISISTLIQVQRSSASAMDSVMFRKSALDLQATIEEVCALGPGNQRQVTLTREMSVSFADSKLLFKNDKIGEISLDLVCPIQDISSGQLSGKVIVKNEGSRITFG